MLPHQDYVRKDSDIEVDVEVPFSSLCLGGTIDVQTPQGPKRSKIKAGIKNGVKIRLKGLGFPKSLTSERGDLYAKLFVKITEESELTPEIRSLLEQLQQVGL